MGKTPWTEGPWYAVTEEDGLSSVCFGDPWPRHDTYQRRIADVMSWREGHGGHKDNPTMEDAEANARLISAAPEMAEALADFVAMGEQYGWDKATTGRDILMRNARAALSKARGDQ